MAKKNKNTGLLLLLLLIPVGFYVKSRIIKRIRKAKRKKAEIIIPPIVIPPIVNTKLGREYIVNVPSNERVNIRDEATIYSKIVGKFKGGLRFGGEVAANDYIKILSAPDPKMIGKYTMKVLLKETGRDYTGK